MSYNGDWVVDSTDFSFKFTSRNTTGQPHALLSGNIDVYRNDNTTPTTAGVTLTSTFASVVGLNYVSIDLSNTTFYSSGNEYTVVLSAGTVNSVAVTGEVIGEFSIENRFTTGVSTADLDDSLSVFGVSTVTSGQLDTALTNYGAYVSSDTILTIASTALETHGASTHTTTDVFDQAKNAITTLSVASTADLDTALSNYGASTLGSTEHKDINTTALEDYGASTHTTTDVFDQAKNAITTLSVASTADLAAALNTYGASTLGSTEHKDIVTTAITDYGVSTVSSANQLDIVTTALETHGASTVTSTDINDEVLDVFTVDTFAEPGQEAPAATNTLEVKIGYNFKAWRNRSAQTSTEYRLYNDDAATIDQKAVVSDDGSVADKAEIITGA